jgi:hypothetical protein
MKVKAIIQDYKLRVRKAGDSLIKDCLRERDILKVVEMAGLSRDKKNTKHPHQYRLTNKVLRQFADRLLRNADKIITSKNFNDLHNIVSDLSLTGVGALTIYDTAHRIGLRLKIRPDKVYMHSGTRTGAEKILKRKIKEPYLDKSAFKQFVCLRCDEIEDILCIYKSSFSSNRCMPPIRSNTRIC